MFELTQLAIEAVRTRDWGTVEGLLAQFKLDNRAQSNLAGLIIGITIAAVIGIAVAIPVINDVIADSNASGTTLTILDLLDLFVGLLILVAIAAPLMRRA